MKRIIFTLAIAAIACLGINEAQAQAITIDASGIQFNESDDPNPVHVMPIAGVKKGKTSRSFFIGNSSRSTIPFIELGWNILTNVNYAPYAGLGTGDFLDLNNWKSTQVSIKLFDFVAYDKNSNFGLSAAIGIRANNYRLDQGITLAKGNLIMPVPTEGMYQRSAKKSKFNIAAIHIPVELQWGNPKQFAFSVGGYVDMVMNSHTKIKFYGGHKEKTHNLPVNFIQAGAVARFTFTNFSIFCSYQPTQIFKTGRGPEAQQWTIGIGF